MSAEERPDAGRALLIAALGGLLSVGTACSSSSSDEGSGSSAVRAAGCDAGVVADPEVTSTKQIAMTQDEFVAQCDARKGAFEIEPHCGGLNSCRGMSYDETTHTLTEHTCRATNTCGGFSCIVCD